MVPTFCDPWPVGRAKGGDLPLSGEDGGEPKRESSSGLLWSLMVIAREKLRGKMMEVVEIKTIPGMTLTRILIHR